MTELSGTVVSMVSIPLWFATALKEVGTKEIAGTGTNPRISEYLRSCNLSATMAADDETPWCSAFVNWCMSKAGMPGTRSAAARSWLSWGVKQKLPQLGAVTVLWRESPTSGKGHAAFYVHHDAKSLWLFGGNQGNEVGIMRYPIDRLIEYRWSATLASRLP